MDEVVGAAPGGVPAVAYAGSVAEAACPGVHGAVAGTIRGSLRDEGGEDRSGSLGEVTPRTHLPGFEPERRQKLRAEFVVPGEPRGKGRARSRIAGGKGGKQFVAHYTPKETVEYENLVRMAAHEAMAGEAPTSFPCMVSIRVFCSVPKSWSQKKRRRALDGEILPTGKPDLDNIEKAILDGMNAIVFRDDSVVCDVSKKKRYAETPRVEVFVLELDGEPAR